MGRKDWYAVFPSNPALKSLTGEVIHDRLILVLGWMNSDMPAWLEKVDNFSKVVDEIRNSSAGLKV